MQCLFFGRLVQEKWIDLLIHVIQRMIDEKKAQKNSYIDQIHFFICGDWPYAKEIMVLAEQHSHVHFFGRCSKEQLVQKLASSHYTILPSRFLETFWLTALESLSTWVPVIWFQKWWSKQFIQDMFAINTYMTKDKTEHDALYDCIIKLRTMFTQERREKESNHALTIASYFDSDQRIKKLTEFLPTSQQNAKFLLVSDYESVLWWIETHVYHAQELLHKQWHECLVHWSRIQPWFFGSLKRKLLLLASGYNVYQRSEIQKLVDTYNPDIIWWHSTLRNIWRYGMKTPKNRNWHQRMTYHDLWYFTAFPHAVTSESLIPQQRNKDSFVSSHTFTATWIKRRIIQLAVRLKFFFVSKLRKNIQQQIDKHFVPSSFMKPHVHRLYAIPENKIYVFWHCLNEFFAAIKAWVSQWKEEAKQEQTNQSEENTSEKNTSKHNKKEV